MAKNDNLTDFLTDVADAIREKKGTTDKINPQEFSNEIKGIRTSIWTGHADVEGLKAIGWDDEDIAYYQEHGVNWMEEDDEYHKVSEDNKALYGVLTADNIQDYKDRIVYLPKIEFGHVTNMSKKLSDCSNLIAFPYIETTLNFSMNYGYSGNLFMTYSPDIDYSNVKDMSGMFSNCTSLLYVPSIRSEANTTSTYMFYQCRCLSMLPKLKLPNNKNMQSMFSGCSGLKVIDELDMSNVTSASNAFYGCYALKIVKLKNLKISVNIAQTTIISKQSILYIINNEAATEAITITLHAAAYARLAEDPDIVAALENHPLVSLASA